ncbi:MAG: DUF1501 domain-containing protein [Phycisphaeraceae bacterium]
MNPIADHHRLLTRRALFSRAGTGIGTMALASMLASDSRAAGSTTAASLGGLDSLPHFTPKVKRIIYLLQSGAPSQVDLFDYKPNLEKLRGQELPPSARGNQRLTTMTAGQKQLQLLPAIAPFRQYGKSGMWLSEMLPHTGSIADEICLINSMHTGAINHAPAVTFLFTGSEMPGRPSMGAWLSYGLGSASRDLPSFVAMTSVDREGTCGQLFFEWYWGSGFLPTKHQGVKFRSGGDPVMYISNPTGLSRSLRRDLLNDVAKLNELKYAEVGDPEIQTRISQYEMAYRMQTSVPDLVDLSKEPKHIIDMYGPEVHRRGSFAYNCLIARRLAERGVQFIQLMHAGWDQHQNLPTQLIEQCRDTDQPAAALVKDLTQRGLMEDTLVIYGGEFGRTVFCQGDMNNKQKHGRDHHPRNYSTWVAGAGIKPGTVYGQSDDFSYNVAADGVHVHDFQATLLHLLGIDHTKLTFRFQGRDYRLTDVHGEVVRGVLG